METALSQIRPEKLELGRALLQDIRQIDGSKALPAGSIAPVTVLGDSLQVNVDPEDVRRVASDISAFKSHLPKMKFAWIESNIQRRYMSKAFSDDVSQRKTITQAVNDASEQACMAKKAELKATKRRAEALERDFSEAAILFQRDYAMQSAAAKEARIMLTEIEEMRFELALIRSSRSQEQQMTTEEALQFTEDQIEEMQRLEDLTAQKRVKMEELKQSATLRKRTLEQSAQRVQQAERQAAQARSSAEEADRRVENACKWFETMTALLKNILGIVSCEALGTPPRELRVVYNIGSPAAGKLATISISFERQSSGSPHLLDAKLLNSAVDVHDLVADAKRANDTVGLIHLILARLGS
ncbi:hypothetical protein E5Q_01536 [Mixia osmundae IAM 14324]|uniref:Kinetochore protein Sos7 coiled-coil domain-containing protein n=2 Tax=Mixia osmundae (strain CBS 9802 / IAM 14324 / JCM 22182 / KY 12970) TaxID=764103 RepID=G7DWC1_MIXOS|nr:hypothetical protein E5Q_01536 [Mixia osmundae IAM 14324]